MDTPESVDETQVTANEMIGAMGQRLTATQVDLTAAHIRISKLEAENKKLKAKLARLEKKKD